MRILHILDHSLPLQSGYVSRTLGILTEQRARGWETVHLTTARQNQSEAPFEDVGGWRFHRTPSSRGILSRMPVASYFAEMRETARRIGEVAEETLPDIIHAHSPVLNGLPAYWVARAKRLPLVYEVRALWEDAAVEAGTDVENSLRYRASRALETYVLRRANAVTVLCEGVRSEVARRGIAPDQITVIPNAVDIAQFPATRQIDEKLVEVYGLRGSMILGFAGSFYDYEGLDILLRAVPEIRKAVPNTKVLLVGGGPQDAALKELVRALAIEDVVVFSGRINFNDIDRYYDLIDLFVYPRRQRRLTDLVTPIKPLEAMAKARVVLASDCGGHRELVQHGETGILFKADDVSALARAAIDIANTPDRWAAFGARGRQFVERERTWRTSVANYAPVYERIIRR